MYTYPNGDKYDGSWYKDKRHGVGKYHFKDTAAECIFNGTWCKGKAKGPCEIIHESHRFHGTWINQCPIGPGVYSFKAKSMAVGYMMTVVHDSVFPAEDSNEINHTLTTTDFDPIWRVENILAYDYSKLPPNPVPLPLDDSDADNCEESPRISERDVIDFDFIEEEIELEKEECVDGEGEDSDACVEDVVNVDVVENAEN